MRVQELEAENDQLRYQVQKGKSQLEKESGRARRFERESESFKKWLGSVVGVRKVVEGCEGMLMEEITSRLQNCPKY